MSFVLLLVRGQGETPEPETTALLSALQKVHQVSNKARPLERKEREY